MGEHLYTLKISNLPLTTSETALHLMFAQYGTIADCYLIKNPKNNQSRGYGYVKYYRKSAAIEAVCKLNGEVLEGKSVIIRAFDEKLKKCLRYQIKKKYSPSFYSQNKIKYTTLKIDNIPYTADERDIQNKFKRCGEIADIYVPRVHYTNLNKGFAFVRFLNKADAIYALKTLNHSKIYRRRIRIARARYGIPPPNRRFAYGCYL